MVEKGKLRPGFRFRPNAFEILYYLREKLEGRQSLSCSDVIKEADVYGCHPQVIIDRHAIDDDQGCYVFSSTKRRYGSRPDRSNGIGKWHTTQGGRPIHGVGEDGRDIILGHKMSLTYHDGNGRKTKWLMDEYVIKEFRRDGTSKPTNCHGSKKRGRDGHDRRLDNQILDRWVVCYVHISPVKKYSSPVILDALSRRREEEEQQQQHLDRLPPAMLSTVPHQTPDGHVVNSEVVPLHLNGMISCEEPVVRPECHPTNQPEALIRSVDGELGEEFDVAEEAYLEVLQSMLATDLEQTSMAPEPEVLPPPDGRYYMDQLEQPGVAVQGAVFDPLAHTSQAHEPAPMLPSTVAPYCSLSQLTELPVLRRTASC